MTAVSEAQMLAATGVEVTVDRWVRGSSTHTTDRVAEEVPVALLYNGESLGLFASNEPQFLIRPTPQFSQSPRERERIYGGTSTH